MDLQLVCGDTEYRAHLEPGIDLPPGLTAVDGDTVWVRYEERTYRLIRQRQGRRVGGPAGDLSSPMPGQVTEVMVETGAEVEAGDVLVVVEAMKMQLEIKAPHAGVVQRVLHAVGDQVDAGSPLVELESTE